MKTTILVVAAHPDDEILGCGGTIARLINEGRDVFTLILGEGATSRDVKRDRARKRREITELREQAKKANTLLGVKKIFFSNFPDNRFDEIALLDIVKAVEMIKKEIRPDIIFTHCGKDLNIDHQIAYKAVITATRPMRGEPAKEIFSFEVLSSTEWNYPLSFSPNVFFDISTTVDKKLEALEMYKAELKKFPHPRSLESVKLNAQMWGIKTGLRYAEAFELVRRIA